ncbi:MAG: amino acid ABC transporter substrate-binding protein [Alphaproteobacteria bacterium]|nr:amino acid ABC transporter substrate-binding protein [Alphaproteobacteria bacterium]MCB9929145.1 amino acid ABC transporter substrate-binding protein [Alphaproteobacteria bacterium]
MIRFSATRRWALKLGATAFAAALTLAAPLQPSSAASPQKPVKIGFSMALTGGLAGAGKAALIAMEIWRDDINKAGGLLGRPVEFVYYDDQTNPSTVPGIYTKLLTLDNVDLVVSGYATNMVAPAMPIVMSRKMVFMSLFGLAVNEKFHYPNYFQIMPAGPHPRSDWSAGFFDIGMAQTPKPATVALVGADAEFARNALDGARENANKAGLKIVYDKTYPAATADFTPIVRAIQAEAPDMVFIASYPPDSAGMVRAINEVGLKAKLLGGGMVGLQYASLLSKLGASLNGIVNYDFWVPEPTLKFEGVEEFLKKYQERAKGQGVDPLGYYLPPYAYAYLQLLGNAVNAVGSLDQQKLADYIRSHTHKTVVGDVTFAPNGEWSTPRALMVQFQGVDDSGLEQFTHAGKRVVLWPEQWKSGTLHYPYAQ